MAGKRIQSVLRAGLVFALGLAVLMGSPGDAQAWPGFLKKAAKKLAGAGKKVGKAVAGTGKKVGGAVVDTSKKAGGAVADAGKKTVSGVATAGTTVGGAVVDTGKKAGGAVVDTGKQAGTAIADTGKQAGTAIADTGELAANAVADGVVDAANATAAGVRKAALETAKVGESTANTIATESKRSFEVVVREGKAAYEKARDGVLALATEAARQAMKAASRAFVAAHAEEIQVLGRTLREVTAVAESKALFERVTVAAARKSVTPALTADLKALLARPELADLAAALAEGDGGAGCPATLTVGITGNAAYVAGVEGGLGVALCPTNPASARVYLDQNVLLGASMGAAVYASLGLWQNAPARLAGASVAVEVQGDAEVGLGLAVVWDLPTSASDWARFITSPSSLEPQGFVVFAGAGAEVNVGLAGGYTWIF